MGLPLSRLALRSTWARAQWTGYQRVGACGVVALVLAACGYAGSKVPDAPAPVAAEKNIQLCVIDTIAPGGMMTMGAIFVSATNDTMVVQANGRARITAVVAGPQILSQATWLTNRQPITLTTAAGRVRYPRTGEPRAFAPNKIILLGMMRNVPLFVLPSEGAAMRAEVEALSARGVDLEKALAQRVSLRRQMDRVKTLYVPTALVGCTFQPFTREQRRR